MTVARVRLTVLGLLIGSGTLALAWVLPAHHCVRSGDVGHCADWSLIKLGLAVLALLAGGVILTIARRTDA
jgi:hypothetical protein